MTQSFNPPIGVATRAIAHSQADAASLTIPDAQLLFSAEFKRSGSDLTLIGPDGRKFIVFDYFQFEKRPDLISSDGATLAAQLVEKLSGSVAPNQYAQATPPSGSSAQVIGKVEKISGSGTAVRNGVAVTLNVGDAVNKNDVLQTGSDSTLSVSFLDGTALNLSANTRMALNEYVFDVNAASGNGGHFSLVQGAFAFVSGLVAKSGGLNIETPVANIGIRGTVGGATCVDAGHCEFYAAPEMGPGNVPSAYILQAGGTFDANGHYIGGQIIGRVTVGANARIDATGVGAQPLITFVPAAAADQRLQDLATDLVTRVMPQVFVPAPPTAPPGQQPGNQQPGDQQPGDQQPGTAPQAPSSPGSSTPTPLLDNGNPENKLPLANVQQPTEKVVAISLPTTTDTGTATKVSVNLTVDLPPPPPPPPVVNPNIQVADTAQKNAGSNVAGGSLLPGATSDQVTTIQGHNDTTPVAVTPTGVAHGQFGDVTIQADGSYSYQANAALDELTPADQRTDQFSVTTTGGTTQSLIFDITGVNDAPVVSGPITLTAIVEDSGPRVITQAELLGNASDVDGPPLTAINLQIASGGGTLTNNNDGTWTYHPAPNGDTTVTISYSVTDRIAAPVATTASLDITAINDAPVMDLLTLAGVQTSATTASFTENGGAATVVPQLTLADVDSLTLAGATVTLTDAQSRRPAVVAGPVGDKRHACGRDRFLDQRQRHDGDVQQCLVSGELSGCASAGPI